MTTIFADASKNIMVADSKCSDATGTWYSMTKVFKIKDELIGFAGALKTIQEWAVWYSSDRAEPMPSLDEFSALILRPTGLFEFCADGCEAFVERGYHGIGTGGPMAVAAYMAGATPRKAVQIACTIDSNSGGKIISRRLTKTKNATKTKN
jgi:hypothetical protein